MHPPQIPLTPQTDDRLFPRWDAKAPPGKSGAIYPRMLTRPATKADRELFRERMRKVDVATGKEYWEERPPHLGDPIPVMPTPDLIDGGFAISLNDPVIVLDEKSEREVLAILERDAAPSDATPVEQAPAVDELLRAANAELEALLKRNAELQMQLAQQGEEKSKVPVPSARKKPGRPRKTKTMTLDEMSGVDQSVR